MIEKINSDNLNSDRLKKQNKEKKTTYILKINRESEENGRKKKNFS